MPEETSTPDLPVTAEVPAPLDSAPASAPAVATVGESESLPDAAPVGQAPEESEGKTKASGKKAPPADKPPAPPEAETPNGAGEPVEEPSKKRWYVVKVQSGREESIKEAVERRVKIENLEEYFGQIKIPTEKVVEMRHMKDGKTQRVTRQRKLYPGYLMVEVEFNDRILYLFRETSGVGDFVGGGGPQNKPPPPMPAHEVAKITKPQTSEKEGEKISGKPPVDRGDRVKVREGTFAGMEGEVKEVLEAKHMVRVELTIFGRGVPVELEYWAVDRV
jgi:transcriptional antiterminator NusG